MKLSTRLTPELGAGCIISFDRTHVKLFAGQTRARLRDIPLTMERIHRELARAMKKRNEKPWCPVGRSDPICYTTYERM